MDRRSIIKLSALGVASGLASPSLPANSRSLTFLIAHGAWSAGWVWKKMYPLMLKMGHRLIVPTYTGLGERAHLANPSNDLTLHIQDIVNVAEYEDLHDVMLIAHSYGGMVATGVVDRIPERIAKLIYLDAFVPNGDQSLFDLVSPSTKQRMLDSLKSGDGWRVQPNPSPKDTSPEDLRWIEARRMPQSVKCFNSALHLERGDTKVPRAYIRCTRIGAEDVFLQFAERAKREHWIYRELDASHSPHVTAPTALAGLLVSVALA